MTAHSKDDLELSPLTRDPILFVKPNDDSIDGLMGNYVNGFAHGGIEAFQQLT